MIRENRLKLFALPLFIILISGPAHAQERGTLDAVLKKLDGIERRLDEMDKRLHDMDKRYEIRFARIEERFNTIYERFNAVDVKIEAVNQRIDDKFNLIVGLLGLIAALLTLPYLPKYFEKYRTRREEKTDLAHIQEQIDEIKAQLSQLVHQSR